MMYKREKIWKILLHVLLWVLIFVLPAYVLFINSGYDKILIRHAGFHTLSFAVLFYTNYFWLSRWFFRKKMRWLAILFVLALIAGLVFLFQFTLDQHGPQRKPKHHTHVSKIHKTDHHPEQRPGHRPPHTNIDFKPLRPGPGRSSSFKNIPVFNFFLFSMLFSVMGIGLRYTERMAGVEKRRKEAEKEKIKAELAYLKMQISPHFFFNTLNNIYALIEASPKDGQHAVHQLSRMMRYMIYESERGNVLLQQEVDFLKNYLELMRLRLTGKTNVVVHLPDELPQIEVPPLLFLPFVENAFKHGVSNAHPAAISIRMSVGTDEIYFKCTNTIQHYHNDVATLYPDQGIGLENVRKRLQLLLPDRHELVISHQEYQHTVLLRIFLK